MLFTALCLMNIPAGIAMSPTENPADSFNNILNAPVDGFQFSEVLVNDVILAVSHFKSQARGQDGIPQSVITKALSIKLFNTSLSRDLPIVLEKGTHFGVKKVFCTIITI